MKANNLLPLKGTLQHYAWGGRTYLPKLLGQPPSDQPCAELWMGDHPRGMAQVQTDEGLLPLGELLQQHPEYLGTASVEQFGPRLPFLFKVLDVEEMLSIQSHPTKEQALAGFAEENELGIPLDAPHRNFKDDNHKPEAMVALTEFWLLHGFRTAEQIRSLLSEVPEFQALQAPFERSGIYLLYKTIMEWPQEVVDAHLRPLAERLRLAEGLTPSSPDFWAARAFEQYPGQDGQGYDRGVFSIYLLNLVGLLPGQGIYQGAGIPHAYLQGVNVELMANSDNVFRGGLTPKHVDVPQLLKHLSFEPVVPKVIQGEPQSAAEWAYPTPAEDFQLSRIALPEGASYESPAAATAQIALLLSGEAELSTGQVFRRGEAFFVPAGTAYRLTARREVAIYRASAGG